ncbi:hypothetical protein ACH5Y9_11735 [Methylomonas sp. BW4-1]|uniref:hypothetical protein n=1 Tax=Methylomonas sp. BW4-1 TaxID=3376685 RepID=UPI0040424FA5
MSEKLKTVAVIAEDSDKQRNHFRDLTERMEDAINGLKALEILLAGNQDRAISEISNLTEPFIKNMVKINRELMDFFYSSGVVFAYPAKDDKADRQSRGEP